MRAIRILLQFILGLFSAAVVITISDNDLTSSLVMLSIFVLTILVLGPFWPSQENIERWSKKWRFQLPTDDPKVAIYAVNFLGAAYGFYKAWDTHENPTRELGRYESTALAVFGINGVIAFWLFLAFACLIYGLVTHSKSKKG